MTDIAISIQGLSKRYAVEREAKSALDVTYREAIVGGARSLVRSTGDFLRGRAARRCETRQDFWALRDVTFDVMRGEVLGIIGRNGAGKSTLLKVISRITEPTEGRLCISGRVGSLLEVGTGFHPELSGRENIYLNGAVLGMTRREILGKFDEIVEFAEVAKFLDTPVKRYSSGMYVRLAFAVAAHLEPDILVVDEVLAVGDAQFQKKCLGKMRDVASRGRTVLFVSHNLGVMERLTQRALVLESGTCAFIGSPAAAVARYAEFGVGENIVEFDVEKMPRKYPGNGAARILRLRFDRPIPVFESDEGFRCIASIRAEEEIPGLRFSMAVLDVQGAAVGSCFGPGTIAMKAGEELDVQLAVPNMRLAPGKYSCGLSIGKGNYRSGHVDFDVVLDTLHFEVRPEEGDSGTVSFWTRGWGSIIFPDIEQTVLGTRP
ncbi:MAG: ABC transporter ATP-binding protein [Usitatibacter sp.]